MSSANLDPCARSTRRGNVALQLGQWAHPEIECVSDEPQIPLDASGVTELGKVWGNWLHAWNGFHIDADECREVDGERVLVLHTTVGATE